MNWRQRYSHRDVPYPKDRENFIRHMKLEHDISGMINYDHPLENLESDHELSHIFQGQGDNPWPMQRGSEFDFHGKGIKQHTHSDGPEIEPFEGWAH